MYQKLTTCKIVGSNPTWYSKPVVEIASYIDGFVKFTNAHPGVKFFVTRVGCGLAGLKDDDIAPLFKGCSDNCNLPDQWKTYFMPAGRTTKDI